MEGVTNTATMEYGQDAQTHTDAQVTITVLPTPKTRSMQVITKHKHTPQILKGLGAHLTKAGEDIIDAGKKTAIGIIKEGGTVLQKKIMKTIGEVTDKIANPIIAGVGSLVDDLAPNIGRHRTTDATEEGAQVEEIHDESHTLTRPPGRYLDEYAHNLRSTEGAIVPYTPERGMGKGAKMARYTQINNNPSAWSRGERFNNIKRLREDRAQETNDYQQQTSDGTQFNFLTNKRR